MRSFKLHVLCLLGLGLAQDQGCLSEDSFCDERPDALELLQQKARKVAVAPDSPKMDKLMELMEEQLEMVQDLEKQNADLKSEFKTKISELQAKVHHAHKPSEASGTAPHRTGAVPSPAWLKNKPAGLRFNYKDTCNGVASKEPMALVEEAGNSTFNSHAARRFESPCSAEEVPIRTFSEGAMKVTCCPASSMECAGCSNYNVEADKCEECAPGFVQAGGESAATCQMCQDLDPWSTSTGRTCAEVAASKLCDKGKVSFAFEAELTETVRGASAETACCACGGGIRSPTPFLYPASTEILPLGSEVNVLPKPRVASSYSSKDCTFHKEGLQLDRKTGAIYGVVNSDEPTSITCSVAGSDSHLHVTSSASVTLNFEYFAYPEKTLAFAPGSQYTPMVAKKHTKYGLVCTPEVCLPQMTLANA